MRTSTVRQAAILTGGLGSRLGELTTSRPKPLLSCGDRPFLAWLLRELSRFGVEEILLLTGHLGETVEAALPIITATLPKPLRITCNREERPAGTGGALFHAREHLAERFLLCNGDSLLDFNLARLLTDAACDPDETVGRIVLRRVDNATRYGVVETDGDQVTAFRERAETEQPGIINAGLYLFDRRVLDEASPVCSLERDLMPALASRGILRGTVADGYFVDIGVPADLARAQTELPARLLRRALFLDRGVVIDLDHGWDAGPRERFTFVPGAMTAIRAASDAGWHVFLVINQSAHFLYNEMQFGSLCTWMTDEIRAEGGTIDDVCYCPFHPEAPFEADPRASGMLLDLLARWQLNPARCLLIGDRHSDLAAAAAAVGIPAHLLADYGDLAEFVALLLGRASHH